MQTSSGKQLVVWEHTARFSLESLGVPTRSTKCSFSRSWLWTFWPKFMWRCFKLSAKTPLPLCLHECIFKSQDLKPTHDNCKYKGTPKWHVPWGLWWHGTLGAYTWQLDTWESYMSLLHLRIVFLLTRDNVMSPTSHHSDQTFLRFDLLYTYSKAPHKQCCDHSLLSFICKAPKNCNRNASSIWSVFDKGEKDRGKVRGRKRERECVWDRKSVV